MTSDEQTYLLYTIVGSEKNDKGDKLMPLPQLAHYYVRTMFYLLPPNIEDHNSGVMLLEVQHPTKNETRLLRVTAIVNTKFSNA